MQDFAVTGTNQGLNTSIPYLRSDLDALHVEFTARNLAEDLFDRRKTFVHDGRAAQREPSLDREGFELVRHRCPVVEDRLEALKRDYLFNTKTDAQAEYVSQTIPLVRELTGARDVFSANSSTIRYSAVLENTKAMTPAMWAHFDFDAQDTERQLKEVLELSGFKPEPYSRFVLYQGWRALSAPPQDFPLAICDGRTVTNADIIPIEYRGDHDDPDAIYRSSGARFSPRHEWWYYSDMGLDEILIFKGYDSALGETLKTLHVAIENPTPDRTVPRISIESRYFALFE